MTKIPTLNELLNKLSKPIENKDSVIKYYKLIADGTIIKEPSIVLAAQAMVILFNHVDTKKHKPLTECVAQKDGDCNHKDCPQLTNRQPHCPLDK